MLLDSSVVPTGYLHKVLAYFFKIITFQISNEQILSTENLWLYFCNLMQIKLQRQDIEQKFLSGLEFHIIHDAKYFKQLLAIISLLGKSTYGIYDITGVLIAILLLMFDLCFLIFLKHSIGYGMMDLFID